MKELAARLTELGLLAEQDGDRLIVSNPVSPSLETVVVIDGDHYVSFGGMTVGRTKDPDGAAERIAHLLGMIHPG